MSGENTRNRHRSGRGRAVFRAALGAVAVAVVLAALQILFDVPVAPFLVPDRGAADTSVTAAFDGSVQKAAGSFTLNSLPSVTVQRGIPAEITLRLKESDVDVCTDGVVIKDFGVDQDCSPGDNAICFTPEESGAFTLQCRMGNIKSTITVVESLGFNPAAPEPATEEPPTPPVQDEAPFESPTTVEMSPEDTPDSSPVPWPVPWVRPRVGSPFIPRPSLQPDAPTETPAPPETHVAAEPPIPSETPVFEKEDGDPGTVGEWLENQLIPGSGEEGAREIRTWTGWIFDRDCVGIDPVRHTKMCNLMGSCYDSGLGMFEYVPGKAFDTYTAVETFLCFDGASKELCAAFLYALPDDWKNNVTVKVSGYAINNIPASDDELLIPETDLSRVTHYLNGIHVTKLEAAYIDGLSTNPLPEPNIVFSQP
jgi:hypothetical protein